MSHGVVRVPSDVTINAPEAPPPTSEEAPAAKPARPSLIERIFGIDLRSLACFRILLAGYVLLDLVFRLRELEIFYTDYGAFPIEAAMYHPDAGPWHILSPYMYVGSTFGILCLFVIHALFAIGLLVGWKTRLMTFLTWFMTLALQARNPLVLHSGDVYLRLLLLWSLFLPLGARWSVDGAASELVARRLPVPKTALSLGTVGILLQIGLMYWFTVVLKSAPEWRRDFTAVYYALSIEQYATPIGQWLREIRWAMKPLTLLTIVLEAFGPVLAFLPVATERVRIWVVATFICFHLFALGLTINIGLFAITAAFPWVLFLPGIFWDELAERWLRLPNFPLKRTVMDWRERLIDWRSRRIARRVASEANPPRIQTSILAQGIAGYLIFHVLWINFTGAGFKWTLDWPWPPRPVTTLTRTDQWWAMFAPRPTIEDGWYVIAGRTVSGRTVDLFRDGQPLDLRKPDAMEISRLYRSDRWGKFLMNLWGRDFGGYRLYYGRYLDRKWHQTHRDGEALVGFDIYFMYKETPPDYGKYQVVPRLVYSYTCNPSGK